jgi:hypothetical protein
MSSKKDEKLTVEQIAAECKAQGWTFDKIDGSSFYSMKKDGMIVQFSKAGNGYLSVFLDGWDYTTAHGESQINPATKFVWQFYTHAGFSLGKGDFGIKAGFQNREETARQIMRRVTRQDVEARLLCKLDDAVKDMQEHLKHLEIRRALFKERVPK